MKLLLGLTRFMGTDIITHDGIEGVFIPILFNGIRRRKMKGRKKDDVFATIYVNPSMYRKKCDYCCGMM